MKNKKTFIILAVVLVLAGGIFFILKDKIFVKNSPMSALSGSPKTLKDILGLGTAQKCTYGGGTLYVAGGKVRGDFVSMDSESPSAHMIVDGNTSYVWTDNSAQGYKMAYDLDASGASTESESTVSETINPAAPEDYACSAWIVDSSLFSLPANIQFTDVSSMIPATQNATSGSQNTVSQCSYCDALDGDQKAQCLSSLNCE